MQPSLRSRRPFGSIQNPPEAHQTGHGLCSQEQNGDDRKEIAQPTQIEFVETPLKDVVAYLQDLHHIKIQLDFAALKEAAIDENTPVTKKLKGISLRSALNLLLDELQLKSSLTTTCF